MLKKIFNLSLISIVCLLCGGFSVNAMSFKDGDKMYVLEEMEIDCSVEDIQFLDVDKNNNLIFAGNEDFEFYKVGKDKKCIAMTNQEKLDFISLEYIYYDIIEEGETEENLEYNIVKFTDSSFLNVGYIKTEDEELVDNKEYYLKHEQFEGEFTPVLDLKEEDLDTYYEYVYLKLPRNAEIDENLTYYKHVLGNLYEKVENPYSEEILSYYLITDNENDSEEEEILTIDKEVIDVLKENYSHFYVEKSKEKDEFYIVAAKEHEDLEGVYITYDVYDIEGNLFDKLKDIDDIDTFHNSLFGVTKDEKTQIYNSDLNLLYETEKILFLYESGYNENIHYMFAVDKEAEEMKNYYMYVYELLECSGQTYDNKDLTFRFSGELDKLEKVLVNEKELDKNNYTLESGSTIITLKKDYLNNLSKGEYTLKLVYNDGGEVSTTFNVKELVKNPQTFDGINTYFIIGFISIIGLLVTLISLKKVNKN